MIKPKPLKKGSVVAIVAPARAAKEKDLSFTVNWMKSLGYKLILADNINNTYHQFAGDDQARLNALQKIIDDESVDAIWCAKGGYGCVRIVDLINFEYLKKKPKWFIGYSDPSVIHLALQRQGMMSIHGAMPVGLKEKSDKTRDYLIDMLSGKPLYYRLESKLPFNRDGFAEGELIGGNLSVIYSVIGSQTSLISNNKILFLEDLDEYLYHIDRMMINLKRNGVFDQINGLIVGSFNDMNDNEVGFGKTAYEIIYDVIKSYNFPVYFGFPAGHEVDNFPLLLGDKVKMKVKNAKLELEHGIA